ncbi:VanZ family protein [Demequina sp. SO4-13]|uniref:VanZ family protein n=1 Tax=Demequina sp. SO4-13 TaxID=3401027 RepID=UPI003AF72DAD
MIGDELVSAISFGAFGTLALVAAGLIGARRGRATRYVLWTALILCLFVIAVVTLGSTVTSQFQGDRRLNLVPFQEIDRGLGARGSGAWDNLVGNIALFLPFGFVTACLVRGGFLIRVAATFISGFVLSLSIEISQYVLGRVADVDDVLLNSAGALAGGLLGALLSVIVLSTRRGVPSGHVRSRRS